MGNRTFFQTSGTGQDRSPSTTSSAYSYSLDSFFQIKWKHETNPWAHTLPKGFVKEKTKAMWISFCPFLPDPSELETCIAIARKYLRRRIILFLLGFFTTVARGLTSGESICLRFWNSAIAPWSAYDLSPSGKTQPFKHVAWALALLLCLCLSLSLTLLPVFLLSPKFALG